MRQPWPRLLTTTVIASLAACGGAERAPEETAAGNRDRGERVSAGAVDTDRAEGDVSAAVVNATTRFCDAADSTIDTGNGSVVTTLDDVAPLGASVGDSNLESFNNCRVGNAIVSGSTSYRLTNVTGAPYTLGVWSITSARTSDITTRIGAAISVHQGAETATTEFTGTGEFVRTTAGNSTHTTTTGGTPFTMSRQYSIRTVTDNNTGVSSREFTITHDNSVAGNTVSTTMQPLISTRTRGAPVALPGGATINTLANYTRGAIRVTETAPSGSVTTSNVTVQADGSVRVERDLNGDGVADQVFPSLPWAQLADLHLRIEGP